MHIEEMDEEELDMELSKMEDNKKEVEKEIENIKAYFEEEDLEMSRRYSEIDKMRQNFNPENRELFSKLDEIQDLLVARRQIQNECVEEMNNAYKKKQNEWLAIEDDISERKAKLNEDK